MTVVTDPGNPTPPATEPGPPFGYWRGVLALGGPALVLLILAYAVVEFPESIHRENGPLENMQLTLWLLSAGVAAWAYRRWTDAADRLHAFWMALVALLAALREVDAHLLLGPQYLGRFGIVYRLDWLLNSAVSLPLRVGFVTAVAALVGAVLYPLSRLRLPYARLARRGDAAAGLLALAFLLIPSGYACDDLLRPVVFMSKTTRQAIEESAEFLGAAAYLGSAFAFAQTSLARRLRHAGSPPRSTTPGPNQ